MSEPALRVVTYNVHGCLGRDGLRDPERIARVIDHRHPQVVGLQEVGGKRRPAGAPSQLDAIAATVGLERWAGPTLGDQRGDFGNAALTRLEVVDVARCALPGREPRGALEIVVRLGPHRLAVTVTHLGVWRFERVQQARLLLRWLHDERPALPRVLLADLNEWEPLGPVTRMLRRTFRQLTPPLRSFPAWMPLFALDRVLVQPPARILTVGTLSDPLARVASDHLPVVATVAVDG